MLLQRTHGAFFPTKFKINFFYQVRRRSSRSR
jgi:hypothetical protein